MLNVEHLIQSGGLLLIGFIIFAESGLLAGFFLPGDTLLFTAGLFAAQDKLPLLWLLLIVVVSAAVGDNTGYLIGEHAGKRIFNKKNGIFFHQDHIKRAEEFYEKHGGKTMLFARFIPIVRTFAPLVAGIGGMPRKRYIIYDAVGCLVWGVAFTLGGYWLGSKVPNIDHYVLPTILAVVVVSFMPAIYHVVRDKQIRRAVLDKFRQLISRSQK